MEIRINTLTLHNFKGVLGEKTFTFNGQNARIEGDNGTGKSTVDDAFTWLLFGKDHLGHDWTNFDLKPIDPATRETIHNAPGGHWVEAALEINGVPHTLRREVWENWVKPKGRTETEFRGHTQGFFIDGVDCGSKKNYDEAVHEWIDEEVFKIITNPLYFIDSAFTKWDARRKVLLSVVGYDPSVADKDFPDVVAEARGEDIEVFRKRLAAAKKAQREELDKCVANINAWKAALPASVDTSEVEARIQEITTAHDNRKASLEAEIAKVDKGLADVAQANKAKEAEIAAKNAEIRALKDELARYATEALNASLGDDMKRERNVIEASATLDRITAELDRLVAAEARLMVKVEETTQARDQVAKDLTALGERYDKEKALAFTPDVATVCPLCGRPYPEETIAAETESRKTAWLEQRRAVVAEIKSKALELREQLNKAEAAKDTAQKELDDAHEQVAAKKIERKNAEINLEKAKNVQPVDRAAVEYAIRCSPEYGKREARVKAAQKELEGIEAGGVSTATLLEERRQLEAAIRELDLRLAETLRPLRDELAVNGERSRIEGMITQEDKRRAGFADELARLERLEARTLEYIKASVDACEGAINAKFRVARWKLFDRTIEGGIVPMCEVTTAEGVPYASMNSAARITCGMDVIRVLSEARGVKAPIFIDNAESVTLTDFGTPAQVVRLVVVPGVQEATVIPE